MIKNITIIINGMSGGGAARVVAYLVNAWVAMGRNVTILTTDDGKKPPLYPLDPAVGLQHMGVVADSSNPLEAIWRNGNRLFQIRRAIRRTAPDILVSFLDTTNVKCLLATRGLGLPVLVSERTDPHGRGIGSAWEWLRRRTYPWAQVLVTQSDHALAYFSEAIRRKGRVIPNPIPLLPGEGKGHDPDHPFVLAMGSLRPVKGHDLLIDAFARVAPAFPRWDLHILGEGPWLETLEARVRSHHLEERIHFLGVTHEPGARLREADLFVLPSRAEGFPNALAEAMACGLPVISFACASGPAELIRDGLDGVLVPPEDIPALGDAMARLMADPGERARLASKAPEVLERFSMDRIIGLWEDALQLAVR